MTRTTAIRVCATLLVLGWAAFPATAQEYDVYDWNSGYSCQVDHDSDLYLCPIDRTPPRRGDQLVGVRVNLVEPGGKARVCAVRFDNPGTAACTGIKTTSARTIEFTTAELAALRSISPGWGTYLHLEVVTSGQACGMPLKAANTNFLADLRYNCVQGYSVAWNTKHPQHKP